MAVLSGRIDVLRLAVVVVRQHVVGVKLTLDSASKKQSNVLLPGPEWLASLAKKKSFFVEPVLMESNAAGSVLHFRARFRTRNVNLPKEQSMVIPVHSGSILFDRCVFLNTKQTLFFVFVIPTFCLLASTSSSTALAKQESIRQLNKSQGQGTTKFLTNGEVDGWLFEAKANEVLIVRVNTSEFDAVLGLAQVNGEDEEILFSIDEEGSNSHFYHRIQRAGKYKIRIHGYQMKGGGNYRLSVSRFPASPIEFNQPVKGSFGENGASFFFDAKADQQLTFAFQGQLQVYDDRGEDVPMDWLSTVRIKRDAEYLIHLRGGQGHSFSGELKTAVRDVLSMGDAKETTTKRRSMNIWEIEAEPGQFQVISVSRSANHNVRLVHAPNLKANEKTLNSRHETGPVMQQMPMASKGGFDKYAVVFNRKGRYQVQAYSSADSKIEISMNDPTVHLADGQSSTGNLPVGGAAFYGFSGKPGDIFKTHVSSKTFDCVLRLFDQKGNLVAENDDFKSSRDSEITQLVGNAGYYRWQVTSLGHGGGGRFELDAKEIQKNKIKIGETSSSKIGRGATQYWTVSSKTRKTVFINVKASGFGPNVQVFDSRGRRLHSNQRGVDSTTSLIAIRIPKDVVVTIWVSSPLGHGGEYDIRILDADWK